MKMKNQQIALVAVATFSLVTAASAQVFSYSSGDVIVAFRQDTGATKDVEFNLGPVSGLTGLSAGTHVIRTAGTGGANISASLRAAYGSSPTGLDVAAFASGPTATSSGILYLSSTRTDAITPSTSATAGANTTIWTRNTKVAQNQSVTVIGNIGGKAASYSSDPLNSPVTGTGFVQIPSSDPSSYTSLSIKNGQTGRLNATFGQGSIETANFDYVSSGGSFDVGPSKEINFDFFYLTPKVGITGGQGDYLGFFTLDNHANLYFTPAGSVVPEPSQYAGAVGLGLVAFAAWRRRSSK